MNRIGDFGFLIGHLPAVLVARRRRHAATVDFARASRQRFARDRGAHGRAAAGWLPAGRPTWKLADADRALLLRRRLRQVGADPALRLAARRDGRPDAGLGADPRRDDGDGRRLHGLPAVASCTRRRRGASAVIAWIGAADGALRRHDRDRADRHQEGARLLDREPARLHVPRGRLRRATRRAIFHLVTHAFFKALLFLGAGAVIHAMHHEQDIDKMGGLRQQLPRTHIVFLIGVLAIAGFPLFSGFFSKDEILRRRPAPRTCRATRRCYAIGLRHRRASPPSTCSGSTSCTFRGESRAAARGARARARAAAGGSLTPLVRARAALGLRRLRSGFRRLYGELVGDRATRTASRTSWRRCWRSGAHHEIAHATEHGLARRRGRRSRASARCSRAWLYVVRARAAGADRAARSAASTRWSRTSTTSTSSTTRVIVRPLVRVSDACSSAASTPA